MHPLNVVRVIKATVVLHNMLQTSRQDVDNKGMLKAQFEDVDELVSVDTDIRPAINDISDLSEYPTFENFMPPDTFRDIVQQKQPERSEICVAFPVQQQWQRLEEVATHDTAKRFIADLPASSVDYNHMTAIQKFALTLDVMKITRYCSYAVKLGLERQLLH